jgi:hypothetical protein
VFQTISRFLCSFGSCDSGSSPTALTKKSITDPKYNWPIRWLKKVARYPHDAKTWPGGPFTIISKDQPLQKITDTNFRAMMLAARGNFVTHNPPAITLWPEISSTTICIEKDQAEVYADTARRRAFHRATKVGG